MKTEKRRRSLALPGLAAALAVVGYANTIDHPLVYDDRTTILNNPSLRSLGDLRAIFTHDLKRPLVNLSYAINWAISGVEPWSYHVANVLLQVVNVLLLYRLALGLFADQSERAGGRPNETRARFGAFVAAALFAAHPMMTEAVGYLSGRAGLFATTFALLSVLALRRALRERAPRWAIASVLALVLAVACKESAATLPFVFLVYDALLGPGSAGARRRRLLRVYLPLVAILVAAGVARLAVFARYELASIRPEGEHLLTQLGVFWRYMRLFAAPLSQSIAHSVTPVRAPWDPVTVASAAALFAAAALAWRARRALPLATFGAAWFVLLLAPSSLIPLAEPMSEHRVYEASCGLFLIAAAGCVRALEASDANRRRVRVLILGAPVLILGVLTALTVARNRVWADPITLWRDGVEHAPDSWTAHYALANEYQYAGRCAEALPEYELAIEEQPSQRAVVNVGTCLAQLGRLDEAQRVFEAALSLGPAADPHFNLGLIEASRNRPDQARGHFLAVLALEPKNVPARKALVDLYESVWKDPAETLRLCREIEVIAPGTDGVRECLERSAEEEP